MEQQPRYQTQPVEVAMSIVMQDVDVFVAIVRNLPIIDKLRYMRVCKGSSCSTLCERYCTHSLCTSISTESYGKRVLV